MKRSRMRLAVAVLAAVLVVALAAQVVALNLTKTAVRPTGVTMVTQDTAFSTAGAPWVDVPGALASVTIPGGMNAYILARFTAESACTGPGGWCSVRIVIVHPNGVLEELDPVVGTDFAFDTPEAGQPNAFDYESHSVERSSRGLVAGTYRLKVQAGVVAGASSLRLDDWHLTLMGVCYAGGPCTP